jgi:hypothetical protein
VFRRLFWLVVGAGFGFGVSFWMTRWMRETVARYMPERVSSDVNAALRKLGKDLQRAIDEGRAAMREREAELRARLDDRHPALPPAPALPPQRRLGEPSLN